MPEQSNFNGFDSKCEDCGNYYASDYIEFHKRERCLKKSFDFDNHPEFQKRIKKREAEKSTQLVNKVVAEHSLTPKPKFQISVNDVLKKRRQQREALLSCQYCSKNVKQKELKKHLSNCPVLNPKQNPQKKVESKILAKKLSDCPHCNLKLKTKNLQTHISIFHPTIFSKRQKVKNIVEPIICSDCGAFYSASSIKCPQCDINGTKIKTSSPINKIFKCRQCGRQTMYATSVCQFCGDK